ncbi:ABC transporter permease [Aliiglaciecola sp. CAU 1673]|uniref:ABC transporter permease n=1 Tax=Aliiglaciecola sp. CAU 1673 TaxID=3032595 RepID=UPI0023DB38F5|nr:ABC transporter permease [Aliiglaciecola sp. CAU 1673]MDF2176922.1 ABC transporter permease [Aliiglaciecola sp. CAU 1673]
MFKRFWAVFIARNLEFFRDRSSLGWNLAFPLLLVIGFAFIFSGDGRAAYKVGVMEPGTDNAFFQMLHVEYVTYQDIELAKAKLQRHQLDILVEPASQTYWVNPSSPQGYFVEKLLLGQLPNYQQQLLEGREIRYLDWVLPGILGMNMMFSCLFGVGYVIVRYRKSSVLKRLQATPLQAVEFISAQILSRLFIVVAITSGVFIACNLMFDFYMLGSYWNLLLVTVLGAASMIAMGLLMASRSQSEELTGGLLNMISWPMMMLSGVWFSLEGAPQMVQDIALLLPLTHLLQAARAIMNDGAGLADIQSHLWAMTGMTAVFMALGSALFRWQGEGR